MTVRDATEETAETVGAEAPVTLGVHLRRQAFRQTTAFFRGMRGRGRRMPLALVCGVFFWSLVTPAVDFAYPGWGELRGIQVLALPPLIPFAFLWAAEDLAYAGLHRATTVTDVAFVLLVPLSPLANLAAIGATFAVAGALRQWMLVLLYRASFLAALLAPAACLAVREYARGDATPAPIMLGGQEMWIASICLLPPALWVAGLTGKLQEEAEEENTGPVSTARSRAIELAQEYWAGLDPEYELIEDLRWKSTRAKINGKNASK